MATAKPPYDPVKTVEGMFMGSVTRIAYAMKDPLNYAQSTKAVLAETAKKFQDALDDCEVQILDAKWYLERQLALNKARREAKAREDSAASAKRKREESKEAQETAQIAEGENAPKRVKTQEPESPVQAQPKAQQPSPAQKPAPPSTVAANPNAAQSLPGSAEKNPTPRPPDKPKVSVTTDIRAPQPAVVPASRPQEKPPETAQQPESTMTQTTTEEFPKPTPQDTPAEANEAFNFESMFAEPSADMMEGNNNDINFDLDNLGDGFGGDSSHLNMQQDASLSSLLPGLESYANQTGDDANFGMPVPPMNGLAPSNDIAARGIGGAMGADSNTDNAPIQHQQPVNVSVNDFGLPALGPNEFDDFLNANAMNFDESLGLGNDSMANLDNLENMDLDFESMFK
ncbi:uncharacterized protein Z520_00808 [Fonsecaea multimorphosa CBS 102226]|uniref:Uncharacterized protein n=1 Tax=Fonsecaea multimorphosa CBS 102226 TaxID=1442371 RepID=A0A0D2HQH0_9EURO|nr:uncharacterized protein Z520_00808 [Fonsecaea multimorphosa CBS 102226]KIY04116.1 hypothetical protein Z520_00808 [Fonsecaea multimorphosa CBS 102226]OAL31947.1 hypothetical protein AYO22_00817 [Fonsecaea multimorphosa]